MKAPSPSSPLVGAPNPKYFFFDIAVACLFIVAVTHKLLLVTTPPPPQCIDGDYYARQTCIAGRLHEKAPFRIGERVEVYDPAILPLHAFFARIVSVKTNNDDDDDGDGSIKYDIRGGPHDDEFFMDIDSSNIRPHDESYLFNTPALCDLGCESLMSSSCPSNKLAPCAILAEDATDGESYYVLVTIEGVSMHIKLPLNKIRRAIDTSSASSNSILNDESNSSLQLRGVVELYGKRRRFAEPVIVTGYKQEKENDNHNATSSSSSSNFKYNLLHAISNIHLPSVNPDFVHPYEIITDGSEALCKLGGVRDISMQRCTVLSHTKKEVGFVDYQVSYMEDEDGDDHHGRGRVVKREVSFARVQRIIKD